MNRNQIIHGDCLKVMADFPENSIDSIVTDPPYGLSFMAKEWDHGIPGTPFWQEALRISKPGAHMLAFGGTRTHHRLMVAIEDAGWEIRDCLMWVYGSGFPKSLDVSKAIDKAAGAEREVIRKVKGMGKQNPEWNGTAQGRSENSFKPEYDLTEPATPAAKQWNGWGTALKPAWEPIILCRKPLDGTVAENVQKWGTGAINIDGCRIPIDLTVDDMLRTTNRGERISKTWKNGSGFKNETNSLTGVPANGRFPANLIHDGSDEVLALFPETQSGNSLGKAEIGVTTDGVIPQFTRGKLTPRFDNGSAARFFYTAKADPTERNKYLKGKPMQKVNDGRDTPIDNPFQRGETLRKNIHPTVKPVDLLQYLCRLITPPKGLILDPFAGSGSTGIAAHNEGFDYVLIEIEKEYYDIAKIRNAQVRLS